MNKWEEFSAPKKSNCCFPLLYKMQIRHVDFLTTKLSSIFLPIFSIVKKNCILSTFPEKKVV